MADASEMATAALAAQFEALRAEIAARSVAQSNAMQLAVTAFGALAGLRFSQYGDARLLLVIPIVAAVLGLVWFDHAANIFNLGDFIKDRIVPAWKRAAKLADLPDYEQFIRGYERNRMVILRSFGLPPFLVFVFLPAAALVLAFDTPRWDWAFWSLVGLDLVLLAIVIAYWLPFALGPRPSQPTQVG